MCARKVHPHFTIYHLPCNQNRVRVTSELPRSYLGILFHKTFLWFGITRTSSVLLSLCETFPLRKIRVG